MDSSSTMDERGPGKNKRKWIHEEDVKLIEALLNLVNAGTHRADNGFKPGYAGVLEDALKVSLPNAGLKARPHIESRIKTLKREFNIVRDMLTGPNTSGFGWDNEKKCVTAEKAVWAAYLQSHKNAAPFRNKSFPFYDDLVICFGKDRATGRDAETPADVVEEMDREEAHEENDVDVAMDGGNEDTSFMQSPNTGECSSQRGRKRSRSCDSLVEGMKDVAFILGKEIREATASFTRAIGVEAATAERRQLINAELLKLDGVSTVERHRATVLIGRDHELTDIFFTIGDEEKEEWVKALLRGDFSEG